ncbi:MAG TPA: twin-arginine translocase TatA/TatE family subunit [Chthoniobacterales bacterium]|nr:twin-arginine translocase TatA/TatE family subunit [Chthoniobacterales bacterium]
MFSVPHLVVLFLVVLVLFGPHKLPELARGLGRLMAEFRKASNDFKMAFEEEMRNIERQNREAEWKKSQEEAEAKRQKELASGSAAELGGTEPKILPEQTAATESAGPFEPVVEPVNEAVARGSGAHEFSSVDPMDGSREVPAEEQTSSDSGSSLTENPPLQQPNDQRQPA